MSYTPRHIDAELQDWASSKGRKPLVLRGARQTGKTAALRHLGTSFDLSLELNLDRLNDRRLVEESRTAADLLVALQVRENVARFPPRTLLFLDEIQECPKAVAWLRSFYEDYPDLAVVAAGSLLEVRARGQDFSFPVGRVTFRYMHPFSYLEFLHARGRDVLAARLIEAAAGRASLPPPVHAEALELLRDYIWVGGMPEAVITWVASASAAAVRQVQADLLQAFAEDIPKYDDRRDRGALEAAWAHLPQHYGLRFKYENFAPGHRSASMKSALQALEGAMLARRALPTNQTRPPLHERPRAAPRLLPLDVGLAVSQMGVSWNELRASSLDSLLDGRVAEVLTGQLLLSAQRRSAEPLYFWAGGAPGSEAEVDYLVQGPDGLLAVEVKAGAQGTLKSLHQFLLRAELQEAVRMWSGPLLDERHRVQSSAQILEYRLRSLPLYLAELIAGSAPEAASP